MIDTALARRTWRRLEPLHGMIYFVPEAVEEFGALGLHGFAMAYFPGRAAPMGAMGPEVVIATFFNFNPDLVRQALPAAWTIASPEAVVAARFVAADRALRRGLGDDVVASPEVAEAAELARRAALAAAERPEGRPLFAGHVQVAWPDQPHLVLWHAQSLLREFRGDGHVATLTAEGLTAVEALVLHAASGEVPVPVLKSTRAWSDDAWFTATGGLEARGLVSTDDGVLALTDTGRTFRQHIEQRTDELSLPAYDAIGTEGCDRLGELGRHLSRAVIDSGLLTIR